MLLLIYLFTGVGQLSAQTLKVTGVVIFEEDNEPVVGATVLIKGTKTGIVTDLDGKFTILNVPSSARTYYMLQYIF